MYLIDPNGNYPRHMGDLLLEVPQWKESDPLPSGWIEVAAGEVPQLDPETQTLIELKPVEVDGILTRQFEVQNRKLEN
jgi:hypothetical protein